MRTSIQGALGYRGAQGFVTVRVPRMIEMPAWKGVVVPDGATFQVVTPDNVEIFSMAQGVSYYVMSDVRVVSNVMRVVALRSSRDFMQQNVIKLLFLSNIHILNQCIKLTVKEFSSKPTDKLIDLEPFVKVVDGNGQPYELNLFREIVVSPHSNYVFFLDDRGSKVFFF